MRLMEEILAIRPGPGRMAKWGGGCVARQYTGWHGLAGLLPWSWWRRFDDFSTPGFPSSRETSARDCIVTAVGLGGTASPPPAGCLRPVRGAG